MKNTNNILIDKFLRNELSKKEKQLFKERIDNDTNFKEQYLFEKQLYETLDENNWSFIEKKNEEISKYKAIYESSKIQKLKKTLLIENTKYQTSIKSSNKKWYYLAVAIVFLVFTTTFLLNTNKSNQDLYSTYRNQEDLFSVVTRGENKETLLKAEALFNEKKYKQALELFNEEFTKKESITGNLYIYKGISELELNQYDNALNTFNELINSDLLDAEKGYWYKALLYLKKESLNKSKETLNFIIIKKLFNYKKAKELLNKLN